MYFSVFVPAIEAVTKNLRSLRPHTQHFREALKFSIFIGSLAIFFVRIFKLTDPMQIRIFTGLISSVTLYFRAGPSNREEMEKRREKEQINRILKTFSGSDE